MNACKFTGVSTGQNTRAGSVAVRTRNKRGEGSRLREDIVDAALDILDASGDSGAVTLRAVARHVGIAATSIYPHFRTRQAILLAALQHAYTDLGRYLHERVDAVGPDSADRLLAMCHGYLEYGRTSPHRYLAMFGGVWNAADDMAEGAVDHDDVAVLGLFLLDELTELLTACVAAGRSRSSDPTTDAVALWVGMHGLAHQRIVATAFPWPDDVETTIIRRLAHLEGSQ